MPHKAWRFIRSARPRGAAQVLPLYELAAVVGRGQLAQGEHGEWVDSPLHKADPPPRHPRQAPNAAAVAYREGSKDFSPKNRNPLFPVYPHRVSTNSLFLLSQIPPPGIPFIREKGNTRLPLPSPRPSSSPFNPPAPLRGYGSSPQRSSTNIRLPRCPRSKIHVDPLPPFA